MDFGGDLSVLDPSMVFQVVSTCGLTGRLKFITVDNVASFFFRDGELTYATIDTRKKRLGQFLIEKDFITTGQLEEALERFRRDGGRERIGNILIKRGYLDHEALVSAIQEQIKEVVYEALPWNEGQFVFFNGAVPLEEDILLDLRMDHLILEGLKRMDEAAKE